MLQIQVLRENRDWVVERLSVKHFDASSIVDEILSIDAGRRSTQNELDTLLNESNKFSKQIGELMKSGKKAEAEEMKNKSGALKESARTLSDALNDLEKIQQDLLVLLPNIPSDQVPPGRTPVDDILEVRVSACDGSQHQSVP